VDCLPSNYVHAKLYIFQIRNKSDHTLIVLEMRRILFFYNFTVYIRSNMCVSPCRLSARMCGCMCGCMFQVNFCFLCNIVRVLVTKLRAVNSPDTVQTKYVYHALYYHRETIFYKFLDFTAPGLANGSPIFRSSAKL